MNTCSVCAGNTSTVSHRCDVCGRANHAICGVKIGEEGHGSISRCPDCHLQRLTACDVPVVTSASPIVAAFARVVASAPESSNDVDDEESEDDTVSVGLSVIESYAERVGEKRTRAPQVVTSVVDKVRVVRRMLELEASGEMKFKSKVVHEFPQVFRGKYKSSIEKARDWWKKKDAILAAKQSMCAGVKRVAVKALQGRGRKPSQWVVWLYQALNEEFARLRALHIKMSRSLLTEAAVLLLENTPEEFLDDAKNDGSVVDGKAFKNRITESWMTSFCQHNNIVVRMATGKLSVDVAKQEMIDRSVAAHLGRVKRAFDRGDLEDDLVLNMDETHFLINMHNGKTMDFKGAKKVKYDDVVSGGEGMTLVVTLRGGRHACIETPMVIFQNQNCSYPIHGLPSNAVPGAAYRSGPRGWMDRRVFGEWVSENKCVKKDVHNRTQVIFMDNAGGHKPTESTQIILEEKHVEIQFLPPNATDLCQPADTTIIQKLKQVWMKEWEKEKMRLAIERHEASERIKAPRSGKLKQPGKKFFLQLAVKCCRQVSDMKDEDNVNLVQKGMIRCGLGKNINGIWEENQLFPHLQEIIKRHRDAFEGKTQSSDESE